MTGHSVVAKMVGRKGQMCKESDDTGMGLAGTQVLVVGSMGWQATDGIKNEGIRSIYEP